MANFNVIKQTDWEQPAGSNVQDVGENPARVYREILMAQDPLNPEGGIPYDAGTLFGGQIVYLRIPHGLSVYDDTGALVSARVPDVVIPMLAGSDFILLGLVSGPPVLPLGSYWADAEYVYITVLNVSTKSLLNARFIVYVEYTHSIIGNEIVTGAYEPLPD